MNYKTKKQLCADRVHYCVLYLYQILNKTEYMKKTTMNYPIRVLINLGDLAFDLRDLKLAYAIQAL